MWFRSLSEERRRRADRVLIEATKSTIESLEARVLLAADPINSLKQTQVATRVAGNLLDLYDAVTAGQKGAQAAKSQRLQVDAQDRVSVTITADNVAVVASALGVLGFVPTASYPALHFVDGLMPIRALRTVAQVAAKLGRFSVQPSYQPITYTGSVNSQADFVLEADRTRATLPAGINGAGQRIGVLSDSFDTGPGSYATDVSTGDLPSGILNLGDTAGGTDEGRAMLQLIYDIAPGASLVFATAYNSEGTFANNIRRLADPAQGNAKIIVDDVGYFAEPFFQDGVISQAIDEVVTTRGVTYFSAAGNSGTQAYESTTFQTATDTLTRSNNQTVTGTFYDFNTGGGVDTRQRITIPTGSQVYLSFQWDDPFYTASGVNTDLDIFLINASTGKIVASQESDNVLMQQPVEVLSYTNLLANTQYDVAIRRFTAASTNPTRIKYVNFGNDITINEFATNSGAIVGHPTAANAQAVAAVPYFIEQTSEDYSSRGPSTILFSPTGTLLGAPQVRQTPQIASIDGANTTFFPPGPLAQTDFEGDGKPNFFGTSAAAPHAAAVAALVRQANPGFTPAQVYSRLQTTADDIDAPGFDNTSGFGLINAFDAVYPTISPASVNFSDGLESGALSSAYETRSTGAGRILVTNANSPFAGTKHLTMDASVTIIDPVSGVGNQFSLNEVTLHVNASGGGTKTLSFRQKEFSDDDQAMPTTFTNSSNSDGVALSVDGVNWFRIVSLTGAASTNSYTLNTFNLTSIAAAAGIVLSSDTRIRFQQYDDFSISSGSPDGMAFDDISVATTASGSIAGTSFRDFDNDGILDAGETAVAGAIVYIDTNNDGIRQTGGTPEPFTTTDASGNYSFTGLANGTYNLKQEAASGYNIQTGNNQVIINAEQAFTGINFANTPTGAITFTGTASADTYLLRRSGDGLKYEILIGGVLTHVIPQNGVTSFTFDLAGGNDSLTVDYVNTNPIPSGGNVTYDGGGTSGVDTDSLTVNGSGVADAITLVNANAGTPPAGAIVLDDLTTTANSVESVTVNGNAGNDTLTTGAGLGGSITFTGGTETDTLIFNATPANDTITVGQNSVSDVNTPVTFGVLENLTVNAGFGFDTVNVSTGISAAALTLNLDDGDDTANLNALHPSNAVTVNGGNNDDHLVVALAADTAPVTFNGGANNDTFDFNATNGDDTITVTTSTVQLGSASSPMNYATTETLNVFAQGGADTVNASIAGSGPTTVTLDGGSTNSNDTFNVTPSATALFRVIGGTPTPPATPGDTLAVTLGGAAGTTHGTSPDLNYTDRIAFTNRQPIDYKEIETVTGVDVTPPTADVVDVSPDPRDTAVSSITITFSEAVSGFDLADLSLTRDGGANLLTGSQTLTTSDNITYTLGNLSGLTGAAGSYLLTLTASGSNIKDGTGNALAGNASDAWVNNAAAPTIGSLTASPEPVVSGSSLTLTANSVADTNGGTLNVIFYRESNGTSGLQVGSDTQVGSDNTSGPYAITITAPAAGSYTYYAQVTDSTSLTSGVVSATSTVNQQTSATPGAPDLVAASDTGTLNTDNVTNRDNSSAAKNLQFSVTGTVSGATVSIYSDGIAIGSAVASGATTTVTTNGTVDLADGARTITARQTEPGKTESLDSPALSITVDTAAPTADVVDVTPDPRQTSVNSIGITFNESVSGFDLADLSLTRDGGANLVTGSQTLTTSDNITYTLGNLASLTGTAGTYVLTLTASGSNIQDTAGNAPAANASDTWVNNAAAPTIGSLSASPNPVVQGTSLTLDANSVSDANGGTINVNFYVESNGTAGLQVGSDTLVGSDNTSPYSITITAPASGSYTYYAQATDPTNLTSNVASTTSTVVLPTSATPGTPDLDSASDSGISTTDEITNLDNSSGAKVLSFTVPGTITGATVSLYDGTTLIGSATGAAGSTTVVTNSTVDLADGAHSITARQTESSKIESPDSAGLTVHVDTVAPTAPSTPDLDSASDSGANTVDDVTNDATPTFNGTSVSATTPLPLKLFADGSQVGSTSSASGSWTMTSSSLTDGTHAITATITDAAGNESAPSTALNVTIDTAGPLVTNVFVSSTGWSSGFLNYLATSGQGDATYGFRLDAASHADELPWTNLNKLSVRFSENVALDPSAINVFGVTIAQYAGAFTYDSATFTATFTLASGSFGPDRLLLSVDDAFAFDNSGNALDGEWTNPAETTPVTSGGADSYPSGNGTAGGDFGFRINTLGGDVNRSGAVLQNDATLVRNAQGAVPGDALYTIFKDVNGSATILQNDATLIRNRQGSTLPDGEPAVTASASVAASQPLFASSASAMQSLAQQSSLFAELEPVLSV